ncbi:hypothetical protein PHOSAC3_120940 [Mesotoga infera]|nr:hypothetical protein PHOSAC3_120940 [Mesotoga infera]
MKNYGRKGEPLSFFTSTIQKLNLEVKRKALNSSKHLQIKELREPKRAYSFQVPIREIRRDHFM